VIEQFQSIISAILSFVVVLSVVVFVHEFGHFQVARWCKVAVDTFSLGFGKSLASWRDRHGVEWKIGSLPLGGYVKFADDADITSMGPREGYEDNEAFLRARRRGYFHAQPLGVRAIVVAAGPLANFVFAIAAFAALALVVGRDTTSMAGVPARIGEIQAASPAAQAGLATGDIVVAINERSINSFAALQGAISALPGAQVSLTVRRDQDVLRMTTTLQAAAGVSDAGAPISVGRLGVSPLVLKEERTIERIAPLDALSFGVLRCWDIVARTGGYLADVVTRKASGGEISGVFGIMAASGQVTQTALTDESVTSLGERLANLGLMLLNFAAFLSVSVGLVNLLPIPVLDGGHLLFYGIEVLRGGRPVPPAAQAWAYRAGLAVLAGLFLFATWNDVTRHFVPS